MKGGDLVVASDRLWSSTELWAHDVTGSKEHYKTGWFSLHDVAIVLRVKGKEAKLLTNTGTIGWTWKYRLKRVKL